MPQKNGPLSLLLIAYFSYMLVGMPAGILNVAWTYIQPTFHVTLSSLGVLLSFGTAGYLLGSLISGRVIGRVGIGNGLLLGGTFGALGALNYLLTPTWEILLVLAFCASLGTAFADIALNAFVSTNYSPGRLNWLHAAFGLGAMLGPLIATVVITRLDLSWRVSYGVVLILYLIAILCFALTRTRWTLTRNEDPTEAAESSVNVSIWETLRLPAVMLLVVLFFVYGGAEVSTAQLANTLFVDGRGIDQETAGFWIGFYWLSFTIGRIVMGFLADRISTRIIVRAGMIGAMIGALLISVKLSPAFLFCGLTLIGFSLAPIVATLIADTPRLVGLRYAATTIGFEIGMINVGAAFFPGLGSLIAEHVSLDIIGPFVLVIAVVMFVLHELLVARDLKNHTAENGRYQTT